VVGTSLLHGREQLRSCLKGKSGVGEVARPKQRGPDARGAFFDAAMFGPVLAREAWSTCESCSSYCGACGRACGRGGRSGIGEFSSASFCAPCWANWDAERQPLCYYYSREAETLRWEVEQCFMDSVFGPGMSPSELAAAREAGTVATTLPNECPALLLPHGAISNSGFVAAHGFRLLAGKPLPVAIIVGNNHRSYNTVSLSDLAWRTPVGRADPAHEAVSELMSLGYPMNREAHAEEHSIENQLPFLLTLWPRVRIVPIGVGALDIEQAYRLAADVAQLVLRHGAALLATTDLSHEGPGYGGPAMPMDELTSLTRAKDTPLLDAVRRMDAVRLLDLAATGASICGAGAVAVLLLTCHILGRTKVQQLRYLVNTEVTPAGSTTGFAAFAFHAS